MCIEFCQVIYLGVLHLIQSHPQVIKLSYGSLLILKLFSCVCFTYQIFSLFCSPALIYLTIFPKMFLTPDDTATPFTVYPLPKLVTSTCFVYCYAWNAVLSFLRPHEVIDAVINHLILLLVCLDLMFWYNMFVSHGGGFVNFHMRRFERSQQRKFLASTLFPKWCFLLGLVIVAPAKYATLWCNWQTPQTTMSSFFDFKSASHAKRSSLWKFAEIRKAV